MATGFKMGFNKEKLKAPEPLPPALYDFTVKKLIVSDSEKGTSHNFNIELQVANHPNPEYVKRVVFCSLNDHPDGPGSGYINDFHHGCGLEMEQHKEPDGTTSANWAGEFIHEDVDEKAYRGKGKYLGTYKGPLLGRRVKAEVINKSKYNDASKQEHRIKQFLCIIPNCAQKFPEIQHSTNIVGKG